MIYHRQACDGDNGRLVIVAVMVVVVMVMVVPAIPYTGATRISARYTSSKLDVRAIIAVVIRRGYRDNFIFFHAKREAHLGASYVYRFHWVTEFCTYDLYDRKFATFL